MKAVLVSPTPVAPPPTVQITLTLEEARHLVWHAPTFYPEDLGPSYALFVDMRQAVLEALQVAGVIG